MIDDWDRHWQDFHAAAEQSPATVYRHRLALRLLRAGPGARLLEIGSGSGRFAEAFLARHPDARLLGLELSGAGVALATRRVPAACFLLRDLTAPGCPVDFRATHAVCSDVLEHLDDPVLLLRHAAAYMAAGCRLVVTVPGGPLNAFYRHIGHRRHYTPAELVLLLEAASFAVEHTGAAGFPFFNLYRLLVAWRGAALVARARRPPSGLMRLAAAAFNLLFRLNLTNPWGWQTVAVASLHRPPESTNYDLSSN